MPILTNELIRVLLWEARHKAPKECCGLLVRAEDAQACMVMPYENVAEDPLTGYAMRADLEDLPEDCHLLALYHSHPNRPPMLSGRDCELLDAMGRIAMIVIATNPDAIRVYQRQNQAYHCIDHWDAPQIEVGGHA